MKIKQVVNYKKNSNLSEYPADIIIENVPADIFDNDKDALDYYERNKNKSNWKKTTKELIDNFDPLLFGELFYCSKCRRLEDGAHRRIIAKKINIKSITVRTGNKCYKDYVKDGRLIRSDSTFLKTLLKEIENNPNKHKLDEKWLMANAGDKWPHFSKLIDFRNKSVLDIGCHVGYSCFRAWDRGAGFVCGVDIRWELIKITNKVISKLDRLLYPKLSFINQDWLSFEQFNSYDIIICMGLLHYFPLNQYEKAFNKLLDNCNEALIIEMRLRKNDNSIKLTKGSGNQTLPTEGWLYRKLENQKFKIVKRIVREQNRELWIARKK